MSKVWKWVFGLFAILLLFGIALIIVGYVCGGSVQRLLETTDIADMTKYFSREQLETFVRMILG